MGWTCTGSHSKSGCDGCGTVDESRARVTSRFRGSTLVGREPRCFYLKVAWNLGQELMKSTMD